MIKLTVEDYCQDCKGFEPRAVTNVIYGENGEPDRVQTQITCARREMCAKLVRRYAKADAGECCRIVRMAER